MTGKLSLGIGLTNACDLSCPHCYRRSDPVRHLTLADVRLVCDRLPLESVGMGTGESCLNPEFEAIVALLAGRGLRLTMASNGRTLTTAPEEVLRAFHDVEVSLDFPEEEAQDAFRGPGSWRLVHAAVDRCRRLGVEVTLLTTLMDLNHASLDRLAAHARSLGAPLRVNVYQPVQTDTFRPSYDQLWEGFTRLLGAARLVSCSEPVVCAALGEARPASPCGRRSVRVTPEGRLTPCVYWPESPQTLEDLRDRGANVLETAQFQAAREVPPAAADCSCQGGCAARRLLGGGAGGHDEYCPVARGERVRLQAEVLEGRDLPRSGNVCTTIVA